MTLCDLYSVLTFEAFILYYFASKLKLFHCSLNKPSKALLEVLHLNGFHFLLQSPFSSCYLKENFPLLDLSKHQLEFLIFPSRILSLERKKLADQDEVLFFSSS